MNDPRLAAIFREEAAEHLDALERLLLAIEAGHEDPATSIDECFRRAHTLKGAARAVGSTEIQRTAHDLEELLNPFRGGARPLSSQVVQDALARLDGIRREVSELTRPKDASDIPGGVPSPAGPRSEAPIAGLRIDSGRLDRMIGLLGSVEISHKAGEKVGEEVRRVLDVLGHAHGDLGRLETRLRQKNQAPPGEVLPSVQEARLAIRAAAESLSMMRSTAGSRYSEEELLLDQLDDEVRRARLVPLSTLSLFLERACRDAANETGKKIGFTMSGGEVTLDRAVIDAVQEPLLHLLRNAAAHGIEPPPGRAAAGKPPEGSVTIDARRLGNRVRIRVKDDGAGVDLARLRPIVTARLRQTPDETRAMSDESLMECLFQGGITTAKNTDALSGRGAGLEIVRTRLRAVQGDVRVIESGPAGTVFELTLPVHLQIMRIMIVRGASGFYGLPTASVLHTERVRTGDVRLLAGRPVFAAPRGPIPLVALDSALGIPERSRTSAGVCVILEVGAHRAGILADEVIEETEMLIRDLGFPMGHVPNIAGAAVRPDGSILLILNPAELGESALGKKFTPAAEPAKVSVRPRILVVDDSPTTRSVLRGLFSAAGFDVVLASDGVEGRARYVQQGADVVVTDIQMPRMDGFAFTRAVKSESGGRVPVVLVTGRESEADRRAGLEAGADAYVVKSTFEESDLIETVRRFL
ncbi:response regulator [bacterium]|nr:response regulator [bacterium]